MSLFGSPNVDKLERKGDIPGLIQALAPKRSVAVRKQAAAALGRTRDARGVDALIVALADRDSAVQSEVLKALGTAGDYRAIGPLIDFLDTKDLDSEVAGHAVECLGRIGDPAVGPLLDRFKGPNRPGDSRVKHALVRIGTARTIGLLVEMVRTGQVSDRYGAARMLAEISGPALQQLIDLVRDPTHDGRDAAIEGLGWTRDPSVVPILIPFMTESDNELRKETARALGLIGDERAVEPLISALYDRDRHVRHMAVQALGRIGDVRATESMVAKLRDEDEVVVNTAKGVLGQMGKAALSPLLEALKAEQGSISSRAAEVLRDLQWKPDQDETGARFLIALGRPEECIPIGLPSIEPLVEALHGGDRSLRKKAAFALDKIGPPKEAKPSVAALIRPKCSVCGRDHAKVEKDVRTKRPGALVVGRLVGACEVCQKAFCIDHAPYDSSMDNIACPKHGSKLDLDY